MANCTSEVVRRLCELVTMRHLRVGLAGQARPIEDGASASSVVHENASQQGSRTAPTDDEAATDTGVQAIGISSPMVGERLGDMVPSTKSVEDKRDESTSAPQSSASEDERLVGLTRVIDMYL